MFSSVRQGSSWSQLGKQSFKAVLLMLRVCISKVFLLPWTLCHAWGCFFICEAEFHHKSTCLREVLECDESQWLSSKVHYGSDGLALRMVSHIMLDSNQGSYGSRFLMKATSFHHICVLQLLVPNFQRRRPWSQNLFVIKVDRSHQKT